MMIWQEGMKTQKYTSSFFTKQDILFFFQMDKATFLDFFNVPKLLGERLFQVFDQKKTGVIDLEEFLDGLATVRWRPFRFL